MADLFLQREALIRFGRMVFKNTSLGRKIPPAILATTQLCFLTFSNAFADDPQYTVEDIGQFRPISGASQACNHIAYLSNNGEVAYSRGSNAYKYTTGVGEKDLGLLFAGEGSPSSLVTGIDDSGIVYGRSYTYNLLSNPFRESATVFNNGVMTAFDVQGFNPDARIEHHPYPLCVSPSGDKMHAAGFSQGNQAGEVVWEKLAGTFVPTAQGIEVDNITSCAINNSGTVVGFSVAGFSVSGWSSLAGAVREVDGTRRYLRAQDFGAPHGSFGDLAVDINDKGDILLTDVTDTGPRNPVIIHGTTYTPVTGITYAGGMNNFGEVVGWGTTYCDLYKNGVVVSLGSQIDPALGITFSGAIDINDRRQILCLGLGPDKKEHLYLLTESIPLYQPDLSIGTGATALGNSIYNSTGTGQSLALTLKKGKSKTVSITLRNAGKVSDSYTIRGTRSTNLYTIQYLLGKTDITKHVITGKFKISKLQSSKTKTIKLKFTSLKDGTKTSTFALTATSATDKTKVDSVRVIDRKSGSSAERGINL